MVLGYNRSVVVVEIDKPFEVKLIEVCRQVLSLGAILLNANVRVREHSQIRDAQ